MTATIGPAATPLLEAGGVSKAFPGVQALQDMHLQLRAGEVLALVGENGAGKSTLMKLLSGIHRPDAGRFRLDGAVLEPTGPADAMARGISIIHQEFNLVPDLTVAQNIYLGREPRRGPFLDRRALRTRTAELLARLSLRLDPDQLVGELTVAHQQLVEIATALSFDARVLIMDEPSAALDDAEVRVLHGLIRRFVGPRTGVVYISHRLDELPAIADRITVIRDGRYVDTVAATAPTAQIVRLMVGREVAAAAGPSGVRSDRSPVLEVRGLSTRLLRGVSLTAGAGEIVGLAGLMGAGRTELARAIVGADPIREGEIRLRGRPVRIPNPARAAALGIGYLSEDRQRLGLLSDQPVAANIAVGALRTRFSRWGFLRGRVIAERAAAQVVRLRIRTPSIQTPVRLLSGGNQQKVVLARWWERDSDVLIVDEPTRGIDVGAKEEIHGLLDGLAAQGKTIIVISSDLPEVLRLSHRVVVMSEGRVTGELRAQDADAEAVMALATSREDGS